VRGDSQFAIELTLGTLTLWLWVELVKALTDRARPFNLLRETRVVGWHASGLSFPSGHTAQVFFVAGLSISHLKVPPGVAIALYAIAAVVAVTRVYVGAHYPRDVIAGASLGLVWGIASALVAAHL
jgi:undecaprenyl-diphosphatase